MNDQEWQELIQSINDSEIDLSDDDTSDIEEDQSYEIK